MTDAHPSPLQCLRDVLERMRQAEAEVGREKGSTTLVAVSKGFPAEAVEPLLGAGQRTFAENRIQEALSKWPPLLKNHPDVELRFVGRLQSNKVRDALGFVHTIESLDRPSLARALARSLSQAPRQVRLLVQVNLGEEPQKGGCPPAEADDFIDWCRNKLGLAIDGVMGIPPLGVNPVPYFGLLRSLCQRKDLAQISMGMSADFPAAIEMGATHVRVGTAIFGPRDN